MTAPLDRDGKPLWTDADIEEAADLTHPPSAEVIAKIMPIVRAALARGGSGKAPPRQRPNATTGAPRKGARRTTADRARSHENDRLGF